MKCYRLWSFGTFYKLGQDICHDLRLVRDPTKYHPFDKPQQLLLQQGKKSWCIFSSVQINCHLQLFFCLVSCCEKKVKGKREKRKPLEIRS
jgi:hypothetical protein